MIDFSNVKELSIGGKSVKELWIDGKKVWDMGGTFPALTFTAMQANSSIQMRRDSFAPAVSLEYSIDGRSWSQFTVGSTTVTLANVGDKVHLRATSGGNGAFYLNGYRTYFAMTGKVAQTGSLMYLISQTGDGTPGEYQFSYLFDGCDSLVSFEDQGIENVSSTGMFYHMFRNCTGLTTFNMPNFTSCTAYKGMERMFQYCSSLVEARFPLLATASNTNCVTGWFEYCTSMKNIYLNRLSSTSGSWNMNAAFRRNTSLETIDFSEATSVPQIQSTDTFDGCTSDFKIIVPDALYDNWKSTTYWSSYASHIVRKSVYEQS